MGKQILYGANKSPSTKAPILTSSTDCNANLCSREGKPSAEDPVESDTCDSLDILVLRRTLWSFPPSPVSLQNTVVKLGWLG